MKSYSFIHRQGEWYIDLPDYLLLGGKQEDLQMVAGADEVLDLYAKQDSSLTLFIDTKPFAGSDHLHLLEIGTPTTGHGAYYIINSFDGKITDQTIWLCNVLLFVFGEIPPDIYVKENPVGR